MNKIKFKVGDIVRVDKNGLDFLDDEKRADGIHTVKCVSRGLDDFYIFDDDEHDEGVSCDCPQNHRWVIRNNSAVIVTEATRTKDQCYICGYKGATSQIGEYNLCEQCEDFYLTECTHCDEKNFFVDTREDTTGEIICKNCVEKNNYTVCGYCSRFGELNGNFCPSCVDKYIPIPYRDWEPYMYSFAEGNYIKSARPFGVELEMVNDTRRNVFDLTYKLDKRIGIADDISIKNGVGIEIQTPPIAGLEGENMLKDILKEAKEHKMKVNETCGLHVHLGIDDLLGKGSFEKVKTLFMFYRLFDDVILSMLPKSRRNNRFCAGLGSSYLLSHIAQAVTMDQLEAIWYNEHNIKKIKGRKDEKKDISRRHGLNLHALFHGYGTVEIRYHSGTLDFLKIINWVKLHQTIIDKIARGEITSSMLVGEEGKLEKMISLLKLEQSLITYIKGRIKLFI